MGPIGLIIDLHSQWHDEVLCASNLITSMGASIIIPSGPHQQRTYHWGSRSAQIIPSPSALQCPILQPKLQSFHIPTPAPTEPQSPGTSSAYNSLRAAITTTGPMQPQLQNSTQHAKGVAARVIHLTTALARSTPIGTRSTRALHLLIQPRAEP
jgi:hypothetical protein